MALQHLYSRVPAKMSLFNKMDGYDTFAVSAGLERDFIEKELSDIYESKPTKEDAAIIRDGALPTVYIQKNATDGRLIQSAVNYLPLDYTGERSAYFVHSLVLDADERKTAVGNPENASVNKELFKKDLSEFDLTAFESKPDTEYPEKKYEAVKALSTSEFVKKYDIGMVKRLIYALLGVACGKTKGIYISLPVKLAEISSTALDFMNTALQVFPYHIRGLMPFVTYAGDITKYPSLKVKFLPVKFAQVPTAKGVELRFETREFSGISDENVAANGMIVDFFYELFSNDAIRREFLCFAQFAVSKDQSLEKPTLKNLTDLVFLFKQCSGFYDEKDVLRNDDAVYNFVCTYDKNRTSMTDEYRAQALKCLNRYVNSNIAIPKNVFNKVQSMYPTETVASKHNVMSVVSELIHTDAMRDKLFNFIKINYSGESDDTRKKVMNDICRVYYGGFLQAQIIEFFDEHFSNEPEETRDVIVEKLLLTLRTASIQNSILGFFDKYYSELSDKQKSRFYETFYEALGECDALADGLRTLVDKNIVNEPEEQREIASNRICKLVENDQRTREPKLMKSLLIPQSFCARVIMKNIFTAWSGRKIFDEYINNINTLSLKTRTEIISEIWQTVPDMDDAVADKMTEIISSGAGDDKTDLFVLIEAEKEIKEQLSINKNAEKFAQAFCEASIHPSIAKMIICAFDSKKHPDGVETLEKYAEENPYIKECEQYSYINDFRNILEFISDGKGKEALEACERFSPKAVKSGLAENIAKYFNGKEQTASSKIISEVIINYLKSSETGLNEIYASLNENSNTEEENMKAIILSLKEIYGYDPIKEAVKSDLSTVIGGFLRKYEKKGKKFILQTIQEIPGGEYAEMVKQRIEKPEGKSGGFFSKLFKK